MSKTTTSQALSRKSVVGRVAHEEWCALVSNHPAATTIVRRVETAAVRKMPILIRGETGTSKEQLARHAHAASRRSGAPRVVTSLAET